MKLTVLGTGGSEGVPVPYCKCKVCTSGEQRLRPSYHLRISSKSELLIEAGPDFRIQQLNYNFDFTHCFLSHEHFDHINGLLEMRQCFIPERKYLSAKDSNFTLRSKLPKKFFISQELHDRFYAMKQTESVGQAYQELIQEEIFNPIILKPNEFQKADDFELAILYNLHKRIISNGFVLKADKKTIVYLADMSTMDDISRDFINKTRPDLIIIHTPFFYASPDHIGVELFEEFYQKYKVLLGHFSHKSGLLLSDMKKDAKKRSPNLIIGYDGLVIDI